MLETSDLQISNWARVVQSQRDKNAEKAQKIAQNFDAFGDPKPTI